MGTCDITLLLAKDPTSGLTADAATFRRSFLEEGGYSLSRGEAGAGICLCETVMGGAALDGKGVGLRLELAYEGLDFLQLGIRVVVVLDVRRQSPVAGGFGRREEYGEGGLIGRHGLDEPAGEDVRRGLRDDGGKGLEFVGMNAGADASEGALDQVG